jgi:F-type H+-transporting ATPase subunit a
MFPLKVIEEVTLPVSLSLRLFGNILGGLIVVELWMHFMEFLSSLICDIPFLRAVTVLPLNAFFDIFEPAIQTYIFTMLTMVFLQSAVAMMPSKHHNKY